MWQGGWIAGPHPEVGETDLKCFQLLCHSVLLFVFVLLLFFFPRDLIAAKRDTELTLREMEVKVHNAGTGGHKHAYIFLCAHVWYNGWDMINTQVLPKCLKK